MKYSNIEKLVNYGSTYRRQDLADLLEAEKAWDLADDICAVMLTMKSTMPDEVWQKMISNLLTFTVHNQFELLVEAEDDDENSTGNPTGE